MILETCQTWTMLTLQAMGGFPPPEITWWVGTRRLQPEQMVGSAKIPSASCLGSWVFSRKLPGKSCCTQCSLAEERIRKGPAGYVALKIIVLRVFSIFFKVPAAPEQGLCKGDHPKCIRAPMQQWRPGFLEMHKMEEVAHPGSQPHRFPSR